MFKSSVVATALLVLAVAGIMSVRRAPGHAEEAAVGRYQTEVVGSHNRLFAVAVRLDTRTGKASRSLFMGTRDEPWLDIEEESADPLAAGESGTYRLALAYSADSKLGQELPAGVRTHTATGKAWYLQVEPRWGWIPMKP